MSTAKTPPSITLRWRELGSFGSSFGPTSRSVSSLYSTRYDPARTFPKNPTFFVSRIFWNAGFFPRLSSANSSPAS